MFFWIKKISILAWYLFASLIMLAAVVGVALQSLTPVINNHKTYVEHYASDLLHVDVHIQSIQANWARLGPEIHLKGISLVDTSSGNDVTLVAAEDLTLQLGVLKTLWHRAVYFSSISISGSNVNIQEIAPNIYSINNALSIDLSDQSASRAPEFLAWLVTQNSIRIRNFSLNLQQLNNRESSITLNRTDVYQSKKAEGKDRLSFFVDADVQTQAHDANGNVKKIQSQVALSAWLDVNKQKPVFLELEVLGTHIVLQKNKITRVYPSLEGVFLWQPVGKNWIIEGKELRLTKAMQASDDYSFELWKLPTHYALHLNSLNLADVEMFTNFANLSTKNFDYNQAKIRGIVEDIDLFIPYDFSLVDQYSFSAIFHDISSAAYQELPELHHLSGAVSGSVAQGDFALLDKDDEIFFPHYFEQAISLNSININGQWRRAQDQFSVLLNSIDVNSPVATAQGAMQLAIPLSNAPLNNSAPTMLSLLAQYHLTKSQAALQLLPTKEFDADFTKWLTAAVGNGSGSDGKVLIHGSIENFPYPDRDGVFIVDSFLKPFTIYFSPQWPSVNHVSGNLFLHNQQLDLSVTGDGLGLNIINAKVSVANYQADHVIVGVDVKTSGKIPDYLHYIQESPLKATLGQWLQPFSLNGQSILSFHLDLPLDHLDAEHIQVAGKLVTQDANLVWKALNLQVAHIQGAINFTQNSISANNVKASLAGEPLTFNLSTDQVKGAMNAINMDAQGAFSIAQLKTLLKIDWLATYLSGRSSYSAHLRIPINTPEYLASFMSDLRGVKVNLPETLGKEAEVSSPFALQATIDPHADLVTLLVNYTKNLSATINLQHYMQADAHQQNLQIDAHVENFAWPLAGALPKAPSSAAPSFWQALTNITLHFSHLSLYSNQLSNALFSGTQDQNGFVWNIKADEAQGVVTLPAVKTKPVTANFDYLTLISKNKTPSTPSNFVAKDVANWPEFFLNIHSFKLGTKNLGIVVLHTSPLTSGVAFNDVQIKNDLYQFISHGQWVTMQKQDTTYLQGTFNTKNVGEFLQQTDMTTNFQAKNGSVAYDVMWPGSPMNFQFKSLEGDAKIQVKDGVIPVSGDAAKMGLGKVLSLFSAQSIQRRLQLNFSDLSQTGYSFNSLISQLHFKSGNADVQKGEFDGPEAKIGFTGRVGLAQQDYYLNLVVTPYVTSSLPLIATLAGGPIAGVATYAFDKIAANGIAKFTSYHYLLTGPWSQPKLIDLDEQAKQKAEAKQAQLDLKNIAPAEEISG